MKINWKTITIKKLAQIIGDHFKKHDIEAILVGGACVSIYSKNKYKSFDLDFICYENHKKIKVILEEIGFIYDKKKYFYRSDCPLFLEFLTPPVAIGNEPIQQFNSLKTESGEVKMLTPTDCVKDRLAAYVYWEDKQSLNQALLVAKAQKINLKEIKRWAKKEFQVQKIQAFLDQLKPQKKTSVL